MKSGFLRLFRRQSLLRALVFIAIIFLVFIGFQIKHRIDEKNKKEQASQQEKKKQEKLAADTRKYYAQQLVSTKDPRLQAEYYGQIAETYEDLQQWNNAIKKLKQAVTIYDKGYNYYAQIADDYAQMGDKANALSYYDQAVESAKRAGKGVVDANKFSEYINTKKQQLEGTALPPAKKQGIPG